MNFLKLLVPKIKVNIPIPLMYILIVPFIVQIFGVVGITGWLSLRNGQEAVNQVTTQLRNEVSTRIQERLKDYLEAPRVMAQMNNDAINLGHLNIQDTASLTKQFWQQRFLFDSVNISAIYFGSAEGEFIGLGLQDNNQWQIGRAGGLPLPKENHVEAIANMALDMQQEIIKFQTNIGQQFQIRISISINTRPVVAGVISTKKFIYDLWGNAVNVASRMESSGEPGKIQVTSHTYDLLKDKYIFAERGRITIKGRGEMITYWLVGKKS